MHSKAFGNSPLSGGKHDGLRLFGHFLCWCACAVFYPVATAAAANGKVPNLTRRTMCGDLTLEFGEREIDMETEADRGGFRDIR